MERSVLVALAAMAAAVFVIANDVTALSVALPDIEREFDSNVSTLQWVINAYALVFGVLIVTGGRLADLFAAARCSSSARRSSRRSRCSAPWRRATSG
jgi:MFS family permease